MKKILFSAVVALTACGGPMDVIEPPDAGDSGSIVVPDAGEAPDAGPADAGDPNNRQPPDSGVISPDGGRACFDNIMCKQGYHWSAADCACIKCG